MFDYKAAFNRLRVRLNVILFLLIVRCCFGV